METSSYFGASPYVNFLGTVSAQKGPSRTGIFCAQVGVWVGKLSTTPAVYFSTNSFVEQVHLCYPVLYNMSGQPCRMIISSILRILL